jgi:site-specific recombinase XerD
MTLLRERMQHDMLIRNLAENTQKSYLLQVSSFAKHFHRSPELLGPEEIRAWLVHLREERKLAPGSLGPTIGALRFLYRVTLKRKREFQHTRDFRGTNLEIAQNGISSK